MTIALGKCSWLVMKCQHETLQWGPLEPIKAIAIHIEQSAAQWAQAKLAKSVCCWRPPDFTSTMVMAERDSAARQEHDSRPLELPSWQTTSLYKLICFGDSAQAIVDSHVLECLRVRPGLRAGRSATPSLFYPRPHASKTGWHSL